MRNPVLSISPGTALPRPCFYNSPMRFELFIAARYLRAKRRQAVIGVITAISVLGVAAGVASLIIRCV